MKLRRTTLHKTLPLVIICVIALAGFNIYKNISSIETNHLNLKFPDESNTVNPNTLPVKIDADGKFLYKETLVDIGELKTLVQADLEKFEDHRKVTIIIISEKNTPIEYVVSVMDMALQMNIGAVLDTKNN